ncbi:MAG TPA: dephospho-CoA kinase [Paludibacteraceae bacterium]|jgi:dephospho-CoA kinase|nr:dephospho-CoA kinase [Paludibacteraceae bacterium]HQF51260.1 dephospho-CoA kinase [Paludibacteraceae bacterium]
MIKIAITGGIGSGKSVVSSVLRMMGIPVYDADSESKSLLVRDKNVRSQLIALLGTEIYDETGALNRSKMSSMIFNDKDLLAKVNAIIHPAVRLDFDEWVKQQKTNIVAFESALVYESNLASYFDGVLMVCAPLETRIERAIQRDSSTRELICSRIKNQLPDEVKLERSTWTIYNDDVHAIIPQVRRLLLLIDKK